MLDYLAELLGAFILGSFPTGLLIGWLYGVDIRSGGSGNTGATNVVRLIGWWAAFLTFTIDLFKGFVAVRSMVHLGVCVAVVMGHIYSPWLKLRGGKGFATAIGVILALNPVLAFILGLVWIVIFYIKKISSLASLITVAFACIIVLKNEDSYAHAVIAIGCLIIWSHRDNLERLWQGKELTIKAKEKKDGKL